MGCEGLADPADVVALAFDGEQGRAADGRRVDQLPLTSSSPLGSRCRWKTRVDRLEVELGRQVEHGEVLVVEVLDVLGLGDLARDQIVAQVDVLASTWRPTFMLMNAVSCKKPG